MAERENRVSPLTLAGDGLLLLCALEGLTGSFLSLYGGMAWGSLIPFRNSPLDLCADRMDDFLLLAALSALLALAVWSLPRFREGAAAGLAVLWGLLVYSNWETVIHGAGLTIHTVTLIFCQRVSWGRIFPYEPGPHESVDGAAARLFLTLALAGLALALGWAVVRARRWWIVALLTLPPLLPGLLADLYPHWPAFLALCACWCAMLLCDLCKWAAPSGRGKLTLAALGCVSVVLAGVSLAFPREGYTRPQWALNLEAELHSAASRFADSFSRWEGPFGRTAAYVGSAGEADLSAAGPLHYTGRTALRVTTDYSGRLYLRGSSLAVYEGGRWTALPEGAYQDYLDLVEADGDDVVSPLLFPALQALRGERYTATVENVGASGSCVYAPYYPDEQEWQELGMLPVEDSYFARLKGQNSFTVAFHDCFPSGGGAFIGASQAEHAYHTLLREHYLDVPEELREPLWMLCYQNGPYGSLTPVDAAERIARILNTLCEYDPQTPAAPEGVDPVLWFLQDSHRGYCMHYASAATLMLRSLGVPARYVSGFTAESVPDQRVDVPDRAAHAWVEVWVDGFGWYPVEVTPAAAFAWYEQGDAAPTPTPSEPVEESEEPAPTPTPSQASVPSEPPSAAPGEGGGPADGSGPAALAKAIQALTAAAGVLALLWLGQFVPKRVRERRLSGPDRNRAALECYGCLLRLERWGGRVDPRAVELAQKARFSQHTLTREELAELRGMVDRERERLCVSLSPARRLAFRYLWGMPGRAEKGEKSENPRENTP